MASLHVDVLDAVIESLCPQCTPGHDLSDAECLHGNCSDECQGRDEERRRLYTLAALCLVSKQVGALATPHLYHRPTTAQWLLLARTLLARPDLANRVRHLHTHDWPCQSFTSFLPEVRAYYDSLLGDPGPENTDESLEGHGWGDPPSHGAALGFSVAITLFPQLEELDVKIEGDESFSFSDPGSLPRLTTVVVVPGSGYIQDEYSEGIPFSHIQDLALVAPNIHTLVVSHMDNCCGSWDWEHHPSCRGWFPFNNLARLHLDSPRTNGPVSLRNILRSFPQLRFLEYRAESGVGVHLTPREIQEALLDLAPHLETLVLKIHRANIRYIVMDDESRLLQSLAGLQELRELEVDTQLLVPHKYPVAEDGPEWFAVTPAWMPNAPIEHIEPGPVSDGALVELLPQSICVLKITQGDRGCCPASTELEAALAWLAASAGQFSALKEVSVEGSWDGDKVDAVGEAFEARGITFVVHAVAESALEPLA